MGLAGEQYWWEVADILQHKPDTIKQPPRRAKSLENTIWIHGRNMRFRAGMPYINAYMKHAVDIKIHVKMTKE